MKIKLTEQDLRGIIRNVVSLVLESKYGYPADSLIYSPYKMMQKEIPLVYSDHCVGRQETRDISREEIKRDIQKVIQNIGIDFKAGRIKDDERIKVVNRDTCLICVCVPKMDFRKKTELHQLNAITCFIWDGRVNISGGTNYYIGQESEQFLEAKQWNEENQDKVQAYYRYKNDLGEYSQDRERTAIRQQHRDLENRAEKRDQENRYYEYKKEVLRPKNLEKAFKKKDAYDKEQEKLTKQAIHDAMDPADFKALQNYWGSMNSKPMASKGSWNRDLRAMDLRKRRKNGEI